MIVLIIIFPVFFFGDHSRGPWPWSWETWLWMIKAGGSEVLHEEPLCVISKPPNCHRWQLFGRWCGGNLFAWSICLLWWSLGRGGGDPPTQLALGSRVAGGQVIQRRSVMGSSLSQRKVGGCANFVTDGIVWLPCPALLKSPCPETIHQNPSNNMFTNQNWEDGL